MDDLKQFKKKLEFSEARFKAIAKTATDSIVISDENSSIVFANKKTYEIFGYREGELLGLDLAHLMPEKYREAHKAGVLRYIHSGTAKLIGHTIEIEGLRKDGSVFPLELSLSSWREENTYFFSGIIRDITKRSQYLKDKEKASIQLQKQQEELKAANKELQAFQEELQTANEELKASQEELKATNDELIKKEKILKSWNEDLEREVKSRTARMEEQNEWLHNLFMQVPALIALLKGREGVFTLFNPMFGKLWQNREIMGKTMREALPELEGQGYFELIESVYDTGKAVIRKESPTMIDRNNNGQLEQAYFNFIYAPYYDKKGAVEGILAYGEDVTEQVLARKVIQESADRFHFMADAMPQKVWTAKADGSVDYFNQKWLEYTGLSFDELKDWGWKNIVHPDDWQENERVWLHSIKTGRHFQLEHRFKSKDGQYRWHLSRGLPQKDDKGQIRMWIGTNTDIHDHKIAQEKLLTTKANLRKSNEKLKKINNDLDNFIYTASHDLKSPILNLEGLIKLAKNKFERKISENEASLLGMMETSILRLKKTVSDLAEITKAQKGSGKQAERISFKEIIDDTKADLSINIEEANATIIEELKIDQIIYPRKDLKSILYNLLSNALKYRDKNHPLQIKIKTYREKGYLLLCVKDNGLGISELQLPKLFTMFKRFHNHVEGTGIGLYIVKRIVENNGGRIKVSSKENQGTTFKVYLKENEHSAR